MKCAIDETAALGPVPEGYRALLPPPLAWALVTPIRRLGTSPPVHGSALWDKAR